MVKVNYIKLFTSGRKEIIDTLETTVSRLVGLEEGVTKTASKFLKYD